jgi:hypothetical protein
MTTNAGYSGTPLAKKLGLAAGMRITAIDAPGDHRSLAAPWPEAVGSGLKLVVRRELRSPTSRR